MCIKSNAVKRLYLILNIPSPSCSFANPKILGVVKQYPMFRQIYEETKNTEVNCLQLQRLGVTYTPQGKVKLLEVEIPFEKLY